MPVLLKGDPRQRGDLKFRIPDFNKEKAKEPARCQRYKRAPVAVAAKRRPSNVLVKGPRR
jgi:hypothetical protein